MNRPLTNPAPSAKELPHARAVTINLAAKLFGYTEDAIRKKIQRGQWVEGKQWRRAPDGRILIIVEGVEAWVGVTA